MLSFHLLAFTTGALSHFVLQVPASIGFSDSLEGTGPCGSFDITSRTGESNWPVAGAPIQVITTHPHADWQIRAALLNDTSAFRNLVPNVSQGGIGTFCLPAVPGIAEWEGLEAVMQMTQHAVDGALYQCAAIKFVSGSAASVPGTCKNSTGITATFNPADAGTSTTTPGDATGAGTAATTTPSKATSRGARAEAVSVLLILAVSLMACVA
ncbi:hypothetical protein QBC33DRAFT_460267 [Phialemonium atrogriseum]|uniref:Copper acquisition factor BIM1-like domain-containing protein n=1 Tax=Phialemonium atrogriseum TaxID=1093897 RepID=A0AAJ0FH56_9PEZI|nr:uncharacterized protein QBC33DRAFT_460267 [Phialemonium atrogriseum]KAK1763048.1 hypothetical protein QBC33DRAFT_460267 [Phialemonium atrogriseum]